eukprot:Skav234321  [mRNA]  locus=scaffold3847:74899:77434:- [translate_table: standard]
MGSCSSTAGGAVAADVQGSIADTCHPTDNEHGTSHQFGETPMWVVKVEHVLAMTGPIRPHQILKAEGLLSNLIAKKLKIDWDVATAINRGEQSDVEIERLQTAHVWLDYFSIPQLEGGCPTTSWSAQNQLKYIESIPAFVGHCDLFLALVPSNLHSDTGLHCNFSSWLQRGWCRTELWCNVLSARSRHPIVVVRSHDNAQYTATLWHRYPVHLGEFTVEVDRARCQQVLQTAYMNYLPQLRQSKRKTEYRLYLSLFEDASGLDPKCRSVEDFLHEFSFAAVGQSDRSLSPVACAALSGDCRLVRALVVARAFLHSHAPAMPEVLHSAGFTPLHLAVWFKSRDLCMLDTLLDLQADPSSTTVDLPPPLGFCQSVGALDLLVQRGAGVNDCGADLSRNLPIHLLAGLGAPCEVVARIIELKADVHGGRAGLGSASPLHSVADAGDSRNRLKTAQLLLESRANINQVCRAEGFYRGIELMLRAYGQFCRIRGTEAGAGVRFLMDHSTTPLGWCVLLEDEEVLTFLLRARADPEIRNNRGLRPIDFARSDRLRTILKDPTQSIYVLENESDLVTWSFNVAVTPVPSLL